MPSPMAHRIRTQVPHCTMHAHMYMYQGQWGGNPQIEIYVCIVEHLLGYRYTATGARESSL